MFIVEDSKYSEVRPSQQDVWRHKEYVKLAKYDFIGFKYGEPDFWLYSFAPKEKSRIIYDQESSKIMSIDRHMLICYPSFSEFHLKQTGNYQHVSFSCLDWPPDVMHAKESWFAGLSSVQFDEKLSKLNSLMPLKRVMFFGGIHYGGRPEQIKYLESRGITVVMVKFDPKTTKVIDALIENRCFAALSMDGGSIGCKRDWELCAATVPVLRVSREKIAEFCIDPADCFYRTYLDDDKLQECLNEMDKDFRSQTMQRRLLDGLDFTKCLGEHETYFRFLESISCGDHRLIKDSIRRMSQDELSKTECTKRFLNLPADESYLPAKPAKSPIILEAVLVCQNYDDYLAITLPLNKVHFDKMIVVTSKDDVKTQKVCKDNGFSTWPTAFTPYEYVISEKFQLNGPFNMGAATNDGFDKLERKDWILRLDADIVLPENFRELLESKQLDKEAMYVASRAMCKDFEDWEKLLDTGKGVHIESTLLGSGYFQLFHVSSEALDNRWPYYSNSFPTAADVDWDFKQRWPEKSKIDLGVPVIHLGVSNVNWSGRRTAPFEKRRGRKLTSEELQAVGIYQGIHPHWVAPLELHSDGTFDKHETAGGLWSLKNGKLELKWAQWPMEILTSSNLGFIGEGIFKLEKDSYIVKKSILSLPDRNALAFQFCKGKRCAEIGVSKGEYAKILSANSPSQLFLIDPWSQQDPSIYPNNDSAHVSDPVFGQYYNLVKSLESDSVKLMRMTGTKAAEFIPDGSMDFVFIDAIHTIKAVYEDVQTWWPKIAPGGWMCGHDCTGKWEGQIKIGLYRFMEEQRIEYLDLTTEETPASWGLRKRNCMKIPKLLHQIWLGSSPNEKILASMSTWAKLHPEWQKILWVETPFEVPGFETKNIDSITLQNDAVYKKLKVPARRSNILRLEILYQYGGVYVDSDTDAQKSIDELIDGLTVFTSKYSHDFNNAFLGATPGHSWIKSMLDSIPAVAEDKNKWGPTLMKIQSEKYCIPYLNPWVSSPYGWDQKRTEYPEAFAVHWWNSIETNDLIFSSKSSIIEGKSIGNDA